MIIKNEWMIIISRPNIEIFLTFFFILIKTQIYYFTYHISTYIYTGWKKIVKHLLCMQLYFLGIGKFNAFQIHVLHCFLFELHVYINIVSPELPVSDSMHKKKKPISFKILSCLVRVKCHLQPMNTFFFFKGLYFDIKIWKMINWNDFLYIDIFWCQE